MSFLNTAYSATVAARLTQKGRNSIAKGNFNVSYFAIGDSEYNYSGTTNQKILAPFDKDSHIKYPLWYTSGSTFFGVPVDGSITTVCKNLVDANSGWTLSTVWDKNPIGLINTGTTNSYVGVKNLLGYSSSSGQTYNTGTTIYDTNGTAVTISPEEQKAIAILHYTQSGTTGDPYRFFKYDDYICIDDTMGQSSFKVELSSIMYHRLTGTTLGATFYMGTVDKKIISNYNSRYELPYRDLVDGTGATPNRVGKIFYNQKIVVFDDEEIVAALDTGSTRNYTLTAPKVDVLVTNNNPITGLTTGQTMWVTYMLSGSTGLSDLPCNYFMKVTGSTNNENVTVKFSSGEFKHLNNGYTASKFYILTQIRPTGQQPLSNDWKIGDFTGDLGVTLTGLTVGPTFTINQSNLPTSGYTSSLSGFGVDRPLSGGTITGTVTLVRASDIEEMVFNLNLPSGTFGGELSNASQNPTYTSGYPYMTEVALLNSNKETLVMGKLASPIERKGDQIVSVKIDF
jgi:hypothetical protein